MKKHKKYSLHNLADQHVEQRTMPYAPSPRVVPDVVPVYSPAVREQIPTLPHQRTASRLAALQAKKNKDGSYQYPQMVAWLEAFYTKQLAIYASRLAVTNVPTPESA